MLRGLRNGVLSLAAFLGLLAGPARADCVIGKIAELPVTVSDGRAKVAAQLNGKEVTFEVDSGAFFSLIASDAAARLGLGVKPSGKQVEIEAIGGRPNLSTTVVKTFVIAGAPFHNVDFLLSEGDWEEDSIGLLGQNVLGSADVEYDLRGGAIRLLRASGCGKARLAYWDKSGHWSDADLLPSDSATRDTRLTVIVNGVKLRAELDSGSSVSVLSTSAAKRAGLTRDGPGVTWAGKFGGLGRKMYDTWVAPVASFRIGEEEIRNTRLRLSDLGLSDTDMLLGIDFLLAHRLYVANGQHKIYFTYNGGPVFDLKVGPGEEPAPTAGEPKPAEAR